MRRLELDNGLAASDIKLLNQMGLSRISNIKKESFEEYLDKAQKILNQTGRRKGAHKTNRDIQSAAEADNIMVLLRNYINALKHKKVSGMGTLRSFSKIKPDGRFGVLEIYSPGLSKNRVTATVGGNIVFDKRVDDDTIDLLTKRYDKRKHYSTLAKKVLDELSKLGKVPQSRTAIKFNDLGIKKHDSSLSNYNQTNSGLSIPDYEMENESEDESKEALITRLEEIKKGVDKGVKVDSDILNEMKEILNELQRRDIITSDDKDEILEGYEEIYRKYNENDDSEDEVFSEDEIDESQLDEGERELLKWYIYSKALLEKELCGMINEETFICNCKDLIRRGLVSKDKVESLIKEFNEQKYPNQEFGDDAFKLCLEDYDEDLESNYYHQKDLLYNGWRCNINLNDFRENMLKMYDNGLIPLEEAQEITRLCKFVV